MRRANIISPLRFVSGVIGLWIAARIVVLMPEIISEPAEADSPKGVTAIAGEADERAAFARREPPRPVIADIDDRHPVFAEAFAPRLRHPGEGRGPQMRNPGKGGNSPQMDPGVRRDDEGERVASPPGAAQTVAVSPTGIIPAPALADLATDSRWSGNIYLYRRGGGGALALATGGQLGASQVGGRIAYRLNARGPARFAAAARLSSALDDRRSAEAAVGIDWHPLPAAPLRVSVERRIAIGRRARDAWSAYAAGGFWREVRPGIVLDGYAQGGIVGARRRDLFADGAIRTGHRRDLGDGRSLTLGAGAWGAAQPRVERLDIGPRVALGLPAGGTAITFAAEWRVRVAGDAAPPSGLALTVAADF